MKCPKCSEEMVKLTDGAYSCVKCWLKQKSELNSLQLESVAKNDSKTHQETDHERMERLRHAYEVLSRRLDDTLERIRNRRSKKDIQ